MAAPLDVDNWTVCRAERVGGWEIAVLVDPARLRAAVRLTPFPPAAEGSLPPGEVQRVVREAEVAQTGDFVDRVTQALASGPAGAPIVLPVGEGVPARPPKDARAEWHIRRERETTMRQDGRVDYYEQSSVIQVRKGDRILTLVPPEEGAPGSDIFGKPIPVNPARPSNVRRGDHVSLDPDGATFTAASGGGLVIRGDVVSVETVLKIEGDMDFSVGNVDFVGDVVVAKSVLDNFTLRVGGNLTVHGNVGAAEVECQGAVTVQGGITGRERGGVKARGPVRVKYLNSANVQSGQDVAADAEILNSRVEALGRVAAGGIVGGEVIARLAVDAGMLGSAMQVATSVVIGVDYTVEARTRRLREELAPLHREIAAVTANIAPYMEDPQRIAHLPPNRREQLKDTLLKLKEHKRRSAEIEHELAQHDIGTRALKGSVLVRRMIHPGVTVRIGGCRRSFTQEVPGPVRLLPNYEDEGIRIEGVRPDELPAH